MPRDLKAKHTRKNAEKKKYLVEEADDKGRSEDVDWKLGIKLNRNHMEMCKKKERCLLYYTIVLMFFSSCWCRMRTRHKIMETLSGFLVNKKVFKVEMSAQ